MTTSPNISAEQRDKEKQAAARAALRWVRNGMVLGLGSGTTARFFIQFLGDRVRSDSLEVEAVASSLASEQLAREAGIRVVEPRRGQRLDLAVDGADEVDPDLNLLKGRGGALLREKVLARAARYFLVIADSSKRVEQLGHQPVPVEVVPFAVPWVADQVEQLGGKVTLRAKRDMSDEPFLTDQGNQILDCGFTEMKDPGLLGEQIDRIPGVVEHGLFVGYAQAAIVAIADTTWVLRRGQAPARFSDSEIHTQL